MTKNGIPWHKKVEYIRAALSRHIDPAEYIGVHRDRLSAWEEEGVVPGEGHQRKISDAYEHLREQRRITQEAMWDVASGLELVLKAETAEEKDEWARKTLQRFQERYLSDS